MNRLNNIEHIYSNTAWSPRSLELIKYQIQIVAS